MRLNPLGRGIAGMQAAVATAHFFAGRYDEASNWAGRLLREYPASHPGLRIAVASNAAAGRTEEAKSAAAQLLQLDPAFRVSKSGIRLARIRQKLFRNTKRRCVQPAWNE
jgi:adenylate cyclase